MDFFEQTLRNKLPAVSNHSQRRIVKKMTILLTVLTEVELVAARVNGKPPFAGRTFQALNFTRHRPVISAQTTERQEENGLKNEGRKGKNKKS